MNIPYMAYKYQISQSEQEEESFTYKGRVILIIRITKESCRHRYNIYKVVISLLLLSARKLGLQYLRVCGKASRISVEYQQLYNDHASVWNGEWFY